MCAPTTATTSGASCATFDPTALSVSEMNLQAVQHLSKGNYQHAESWLRHALGFLVSHLEDGRQRSQEDEMGTDDQPSCNPCIWPVSISRCCAGTATREQDQKAFFLYEKAIVVHVSDETMLKDKHDRAITRVTAALLYNLALTHHLRGVATERDAKAAIKWYTLASNTLLQAYQSDRSGRRPRSCYPQDADRLLQLAIYNNMTAIFAEYCRDEQASKCVNWMRSLLATGANDDESIIGAKPDETTLFHLNVIMFQRAVLAPAA